jgi:hypothetical protein
MFVSLYGELLLQTLHLEAVVDDSRADEHPDYELHQR